MCVNRWYGLERVRKWFVRNAISRHLILSQSAESNPSGEGEGNKTTMKWATPIWETSREIRIIRREFVSHKIRPQRRMIPWIKKAQFATLKKGYQPVFPRARVTNQINTSQRNLNWQFNSDFAPEVGNTLVPIPSSPSHVAISTGRMVRRSSKKRGNAPPFSPLLSSRLPLPSAISECFRSGPRRLLFCLRHTHTH